MVRSPRVSTESRFSMMFRSFRSGFALMVGFVALLRSCSIAPLHTRCGGASLNSGRGAAFSTLPRRAAFCRGRLAIGLRGRRTQVLCSDEKRWDPSAPVWTEEELQDTAVEPMGSHEHTHTLIYLHAFGRCGQEYHQPLLDKLSPGFPAPWVEGSGAHFAPGLRVVLPTAPEIKQPWGPTETSWHVYKESWSNDVGGFGSLEETRHRLADIVQAEVERLGGAGHKVFIGGLSQGCTVALDAYLQNALRFRLGGFVGCVGFMPSDKQGFMGATAALEAIIADEEQRSRPIWVTCAEDDQWVPWGGLAEPSFKRVTSRLPGLSLRTVRGRGHVIDDWEGHLLNDFVKYYTEDRLAE
mmetsp:Transcript_128706/g.412302  ORF Transcript_128706/g.412302 Transcript_128706/m.412302 type:complete len:354 (-) Transcript_128706:434-1495(-)